ncbi:MAG: hypothetical protein WDA20_05370 [Desulfuromonadales bacterium]
MSRLALLLSIFCLLPDGALASTAGVDDNGGLPHVLGEVIFQTPGENGKQIYIIGHSHRSSISGANGSHTVKAQAEVYRIGEWLIHNKNARLLLPEGFFKKSPAIAIKTASYQEPDSLPELVIDNLELEEKLADTRVFVNADILLKKNYPIQLQQVEDADIYRLVGDYLRMASEADSEVGPLIDLELSYLQEVRSAAMLQNIPVAIEQEFELGNITDRQAIFTIGMAHVDEIVRFLRHGRIEIKAPGGAAERPDVDSVVHLLDAGYGVTVILPRTLKDDLEVMRMANLGNI